MEDICDKCGCNILDKPNDIGVTRYDVAKALMKVYEEESDYWQKAFDELKESIKEA